MTKHWAYDAVFYHVYPLGLCGAPALNDFTSPPVPRLDRLYAWLDHLQALGVNALYLGPLFESNAHGYDTADYFHVDRRLGDNQTLARLSQELHRRGLRLILDGVFNHVGRHFWAFRDLCTHLHASPYRDWFQGLDFDGRSPYGDPFTYQGWNGHLSLVKLNLHNPWVRQHLFDAIAAWVRDFAIDGLRLDVADCLEPDFLRALSDFCRRLRPDFWLMGEVVHGDYRRLANPQMLDSVTNYEAYKSLYSSHLDRNYFEIAYALNRQFGPDGLYRHLPLYNFADNHDVDRVASSLADPAHLYPLYCLLFGMPGVPSLYYGSEWGLEGKRTLGDDRPLRPSLELEQIAHSRNAPLAQAIARLAHLRRSTPALRYGDYHPLWVSSQQLAFLRRWQGQSAIVAVNAASQPAELDLPQSGACPAFDAWPDAGELRFDDLLNPGQSFTLQHGRLRCPVDPNWGRILVAGA